MDPTDSSVNRREFLAQAAAGLVGTATRLIIDTHLEVWTIDPKFPFHNPEHPDAKNQRLRHPSKMKLRKCVNSACAMPS